MYYSKEGSSQQLIFKLKYHGFRQIGIELGRQYGRLLRKSPHFKGIDLILPIPLHARKLKFRGYNQSDLFAKGLSQSMDIPWNAKSIFRTKATSTQTSKSQMERFVNVEHAFEIPKSAELSGKHILLVDDVLTTGATLEAAGRKILEIPGTRLSMSCIAMSDNLS